MNWRIVRAIVAKDLIEVRGNKTVMAATLIVPLIFAVIIPLVVVLAPQVLQGSAAQLFADPDLGFMLNNLPPALKQQIDGLNPDQTMIVTILAFMLAPMFLILPIMTSSSIGADSFVGEKERKTIEALLYTPASDRELFVGKMLAAVLPALILTWAAFIVYALIANLAGWPLMERVWFPTPSWWPLMLWVTPAVASLGMLVAVMISARVNTFIEAYQSTGVLVLPVILLVAGQVGGVVYLSVEVALLVGLVIWLIDAALLWFAVKIFSRSRLMGK